MYNLTMLVSTTVPVHGKLATLGGKRMYPSIHEHRMDPSSSLKLFSGHGLQSLFPTMLLYMPGGQAISENINESKKELHKFTITKSLC